MSEKGKRGYFGGISGFKAIAALMVLFYHLKAPFAQGGLLGVTVFFVTSGYLITGGLLREIRRNGKTDFLSFWKKRIVRIYPALIAMIVITVLMFAAFRRVLFTKEIKDIFSVLTGWNNWHQIFSNVSYFENAGAPSPLTHCWSLAIEMQFYLIISLLFVFFGRMKNHKGILGIICSVTALISMILMIVLFDPSKDPSRVYYGTDTRIFSLMAGSLLALYETDLKKLKIPSFLTSLAGLLSLAGLMYMMVMISGYSSFMFKGGQIIATVLSVIVIYALLDQESIFSKIMGISPLSETGKRSYAVYLWHYPFVLLFTNGEKATLLSAVIVIILTALMTLCSELFVEIPFASGFFKKAFTAAKVKSAKAQARRKRMRGRAFGMMGTYVALIAAAVLCTVFVPRENALANQEELEKQAETAAEMTEQKMKERQEAAEKAKEAEETAANEAQEVTETEAPSETPAAKSDEEICSELDVLLIGDSVSLGASEQFYTVFPNSICDAAVSRYTTESYTIYDIYRYEHGWNGDAVIFALGANGMLYDSLETMREKAGEGRPLFLMSARAPHTDWADINNEEMAAFAKDNPDTYIIDWYGYSEGHPEYFVEDDTHLTPEGAKAYTECIKQALLEHFR